MRLSIAITALLVSAAVAEFTPHFNAFLTRNYGGKVQQNLERLDLGSALFGSFGGKESDSDTIKKRPILFVHGVMLRAMFFLGSRTFFLKHGYQTSELYATSYGDGRTLTGIYGTPIKCEFIKQIRQMIVAVHEYTKRKVDIVAWSMGSPVTRKAILGGRCTESGELIGEPITHMVDTFITTGGANYGLQGCPQDKIGCNPINSMYCGSQLLAELNSQRRRYEGANSYAIYSNEDQIVGRDCCGHSCWKLPNANASFEKPNFNHFAIKSKTLRIQYKLVKH